MWFVHFVPRPYGYIDCNFRRWMPPKYGKFKRSAGLVPYSFFLIVRPLGETYRKYHTLEVCLRKVAKNSTKRLGAIYVRLLRGFFIVQCRAKAVTRSVFREQKHLATSNTARRVRRQCVHHTLHVWAADASAAIGRMGASPPCPRCYHLGAEHFRSNLCHLNGLRVPSRQTD